MQQTQEGAANAAAHEPGHRARRVFESMRAWVRGSPTVRPLLEPFWIAVLVLHRWFQEGRLRYRNFQARGGLAAVPRNVTQLRAWVRRSPRVRRILEPPWIALLVARQSVQRASAWTRAQWLQAPPPLLPGPTPAATTSRRVRAIPGAVRRLFGTVRHRWAGLGRRVSPARVRQRLALFILNNERRAIEWGYGRGHASLTKRTLGRAALRVASVYYRHAFRKFAVLGRQPLLPAPAFDPNHVMIIVSTLGPGGAERQVVTTLLELKRTTKLRFTLVCIFLDQEWQRFFLPQITQAGIEVVELLRAPTGPGAFDPALQARFDDVFAKLPPNLGDIRQYAATLLRHRPGVLHLWMDETSCKGGLAALAAGVPRIIMSARSVAPHHFGFYHQYLLEAYRTILRRADTLLLNNSRAGARDYAQWLGVRERRIRVIHNGFHFEDLPDAAGRCTRRSEFRARLGWSEQVPVLGTIIRFTEEKRPELWIDAALLLAQQRADMRFLVVGDGPMREQLQNRIAAAGLAERFAFTGYLRDTVGALCAMDVFLLTSRKEGLPNVLVEAQGLGVPVIAVDAGGAAETFVPGESGVLVRQGTPASIATEVLALLDNPAVHARFRQRAETSVRQNFSVASMVAATLNAYRGNLSAQGGQLPSTGEKKSMTTEEEMRFAFGRNWKEYIEKRLSDERVETSRQRTLEFLGMKDLSGKTFLDIGCGSGIHSLAAYRSNAREIVGFDYDANSVLASKVCHEYAGSPPNWRILQGSVLDESFMQQLAQADIVYSWGVLHHTGDVWRAIRNAAGRVVEGGLFYIALYSADVQHPPRTAEFWLDVKRSYLKSSWLGKRRWEWWYIWNCMVDRKVARLPEFVARMRSHKKDRGMDLMTDIRDWLGGWPMEFVYDAEATRFCEGLGFKLERMDTGKANTEFLFRRVAAATA